MELNSLKLAVMDRLAAFMHPVPLCPALDVLVHVIIEITLEMDTMGTKLPMTKSLQFAIGKYVLRSSR